MACWSWSNCWTLALSLVAADLVFIMANMDIIDEVSSVAEGEKSNGSAQFGSCRESHSKQITFEFAANKTISMISAPRSRLTKVMEQQF